MAKRKRRALLVDGSNYAWRAFHAVKELTAPDGTPTNVIKGFINILCKDIEVVKPTWLMITFDAGRNWRHDIYPEYKGNRDKGTPEVQSCRQQVKILKTILRAAGLTVLSKTGYEADDLLGTTAIRFADKGAHSIISTTDKDMLQLVEDDRINIMQAVTRKLLTEQDVAEKFGVPPSKIVEYLMMVGDSVDNIPGIPRVQGKTACKLLNTYGSLSKVLKSTSSMTPALSRNIKAARKDIDWDLQRKLITLKFEDKCPFKTREMNLKNVDPDIGKLKSICYPYQLHNSCHTLLGTLAMIQK